MKKISIIFVFFTIIMCMFFLPEVCAINIDTAMDELKKECDNNDIYVIVKQGSIVAHEKRYKNCNNSSKLTSITISSDTLTFKAGETIDVFVGTEENGLSARTTGDGVTVNPSNVKVENSIKRYGYNKRNSFGTLSYISLRRRNTYYKFFCISRRCRIRGKNHIYC